MLYVHTVAQGAAASQCRSAPYISMTDQALNAFNIDAKLPALLQLSVTYKKWLESYVCLYCLSRCKHKHGCHLKGFNNVEFRSSRYFSAKTRANHS